MLSGTYEIDRTLLTAPNTQLLLVKSSGDAVGTVVAKRLVRSALWNDDAWSRMKAQFFERATLQQRLAAVSAYWMPVFDHGSDGDNAAFLTTRRGVQTGNGILRGGVTLNSRALATLLGDIVQALIDLRTRFSRAHGRLQLSNVLLTAYGRGDHAVTSGCVALCDPLDEATLATLGPADGDLIALGRMLHLLGTGTAATGTTALANESWRGIGAQHGAWRELCQALLAGRINSLESLQTALEPFQPRVDRDGRGPVMLVALLAGALAILLVASIAVGLWREVRWRASGGPARLDGASVIGDGSVAALEQRVRELQQSNDQFVTATSALSAEKARLDAAQQASARAADEAVRERDRARVADVSLRSELDATRQQLDATRTLLATARNQPAVAGARVLAVPEDYKTIAAAMADARAGEVVLVGPGTYRESIILREGVRLIGSPKRGTIIQGPNGVSAVSATDLTAGEINGIVIDGGGTSYGIALSNASVVIANCSVTNTVLHGISASGGKPWIVANRFTNNASNGICIIDNAYATILDNDCTANRANGIEISGGSDGVVRNNSFDDNLQTGMYVHSAGTSPVVEQNSASRNKLAGIYISDTAKGTFRGNRSHENKETGICATGAGTTPLIDDNGSNGNVNGGISVEGGSTAIVTSNLCQRNGDYGLRALGAGSRPRFAKNTCRANAGYGILVTGDATADVATDNVLDGNISGPRN